MAMMKAQVVEAPNKLVYKDIPVPRISGDEILVKVRMCGVCGSDWSIYTGKYAAEFLPLITGHEFWGTVEEAGENAVGLQKGDRVAVDLCLTCGTCYFCRNGDGLLCETFRQLGIHVDGAFAQYVKVPWKNCYKIPDSISDINATFVEPLTTAIQASKRMGVTLGSSIAVIGGGLGILHAAIARLRGATTVILIDHNEYKLRLAKEMGVDHVINYDVTPDIVSEVKKLTGGRGVDFVLEAVGTSKTYEQGFAMLRRGGKLEAFGITAQDDYAKLSPFEFVLGEKKVSGSCAGIGYDWGIAISLLESGRIDPAKLCSMIVPLTELETALHEIRANKLLKVIVDMEATERTVFQK